MNRVKQAIEDNIVFDDEHIVIYENPDYADAFIGVTFSNRAVYDYEKMVDYLIKSDDMTYDEAAEFIDYNCFGYGTHDSPIIVCKIDMENYL